MKYKYIIKNVVRKYDKSVIFMFKFVFIDNGFGMYIYFFLWKDGELLFVGGGYVGLSEMVMYVIGGIFKYVFLVLVFMNLIINSYKCLVLGYEVFVNFVYL